MKYLVKLLLLCCFLIVAIPKSSPALAQEPPVLAFYYAWFDQNTWSSGQSVDLPAQPYASTDPATIERHVAQAQGAGINAFVQSWYGPRVEYNQTETNFRLLLDIAAARGFQAAVDVEVTGPFFGSSQAVTDGLAALLATHVQHPAYLRYQGKPVIFFWRQQQYSVETWLNIRNQLDPNRTTFWIAEGIDLSYQAVFDGHHLYSIAWAGSPADQLARWGDRVRAYEAENQVERLWVATAMPGYNDTLLPRSDAFAVARRGGDYFRETWRGAVASQPDMIIITSFNEWLEGTQLEPSASYGNLYLDVTRELVTELRGNPPPAPPPIQVQQAQPTDEPAPEGGDTPPSDETNTDETTNAQSQPPEEPYIETSGITNVRGGPDTDFDAVGRLEASQFAPVIGRAADVDWWLIEAEFASEGRGWVSGEVVDFVGDAEAVPVVEAPAVQPAAEDEVEDEVEVEVEIESTVEPEETLAQAEATTEPTATATATPVEGPEIVVPEGGVNVRSGPDLDFELLGRLDEETTVSVLGRNEAADWWQIEYEASEDDRGWVAAIVVEVEGDVESLPVVGLTDEIEGEAPTPTPTVPRVVGSIEANNAINVRAEPDVEGAVVGALYQGDTADVLAVSQDDDWWLIEFADGADEQAWVATEFVTFTGETDLVPIFGIGTPTPTATVTPNVTATPTRTPEPLEQPTFAPTATSVYEATSAALLAARGTPAVSADETTSTDDNNFRWSELPWGIVSLVVIVGFLWYQFVLRRRS